MNAIRPPLASGQLDRDAATRMDPELLRAAWAEPDARVLRLRGVEVPVTDDGAGAPRLALVHATGEFTPVHEDGRIGAVYLGRVDGAPLFGVVAAAAQEDEDREPSTGDLGETWRHPFEIGTALEETERELLGVASALLRWHEAAGFSPRDGSATVPALGGWARLDGHGGEHFPRTDPAVIVLIEHEGRVLLGSNALWETGRFSLLAGFVEAGESLEQTVVREVYEESGVRIGEVRYVASQPWPFPRSLMLGFRARLAEGADPEDLRPDIEEISELRWFTREQLRNPEPGIKLPMGMSIARWMMDAWLAEEEPGDGGR